MLMIGYFEKLDSEWQIDWRCSDSLSLRAFLGLEPQANTPDHSCLSRTRQRIDLETHQAVFDWVLKRLAEHELLKGRTLAVDASTMEANAAMRSIVRKETGETYGEFLTGLATESGLQTPTAQELARLDRQRKGKKCGNDEWHNPHDPDAKITKMKDGRTHLAYKPEHAVDLETGAIVAAEIHPADQGDTTTLSGTLLRAAESLREVRDDDTVAVDTTGLVVKEVVTDKGYHSSQTLVDLEQIGSSLFCVGSLWGPAPKPPEIWALRQNLWVSQRRSNLREPVRRPPAAHPIGRRPLASLVGASDGRQGPEPQAERQLTWQSKNIIKLDVGFGPPVHGGKSTRKASRTAFSTRLAT
jgi:hypothetical protein